MYNERILSQNRKKLVPKLHYTKGETTFILTTLTTLIVRVKLKKSGKGVLRPTMNEKKSVLRKWVKWLFQSATKIK